MSSRRGPLTSTARAREGAPRTPTRRPVEHNGGERDLGPFGGARSPAPVWTGTAWARHRWTRAGASSHDRRSRACAHSHRTPARTGFASASDFPDLLASGATTPPAIGLRRHSPPRWTRTHRAPQAGGPPSAATLPDPPVHTRGLRRRSPPRWTRTHSPPDNPRAPGPTHRWNLIGDRSAGLRHSTPAATRRDSHMHP